MLQHRRTQQPQASVKAPLSAHPAFPPIVGLWFGALFGLGCMVMPAIVLEKAALLSGLSWVWPQAEPPLGAGARAVISLLATLLGLAAGLVLARRVAEAQHIVRAPRRQAAGQPAPRRPISAHEELGAASIDTPVQRPPIAGRRRSLTIADEALPSEYLQPAPLPGGDYAWLNPPSADEDAMTDRPTDHQPAQPPAAEPLDLTGFAPPPPAPQPAPAGAQVFAASESEVEPRAYVPPLDTRKPRAFASPAAPEPQAEAAPAALDGLGLVQLIERLGRSLQQRPAPAQAPDFEQTAAPQPAAANGAEPLAFAAPSFEHQHDEVAPSVPPPVVPEGLQSFMDEPAEAVAPAPGPAVPPALRPFSFDHAEDTDDEAHDPGPFTLPLGAMTPRPFDAPPIAAQAEEDESDALPEAEDEYTSLLAMKNPFRPREEFVRVDEPAPASDEIEPAVVFPGHEPQIAASEPAAPAQPAARAFDAPHRPAPSTAPARAAHNADPAETDRALRSALNNLQRMSGAA